MEQTLNTSRGQVLLRQSAEADAVALRELRLEALREHPTMFASDYVQNLAEPPEFWRERARPQEPYGALYFAVVEGALIGMTGIQRPRQAKIAHSGTIWGVYVRPEWRGAGLAGALVDACLEWARGHGLTVVKLGVVEHNAAALRCYLGRGFTIYGVEPDVIAYGGVHHNELLLARRLG